MPKIARKLFEYGFKKVKLRGKVWNRSRVPPKGTHQRHKAVDGNYVRSKPFLPSLKKPKQPDFTKEVDLSDLPKDVTILTTEEGCKVYVVGTDHFSKDSQEAVRKTIEMTRPAFVMLELCHKRAEVLNQPHKPEKMKLTNIIGCFQGVGLASGMMQLYLTIGEYYFEKQRNISSGGEFRVAMETAMRIRSCQVIFGDRDIDISSKRAMKRVLDWRELLKLSAGSLKDMWDNRMKNDMEEDEWYNEKILEAIELRRERNYVFKNYMHVMLKERDVYLAKSLYNTTTLQKPLYKIGNQTVMKTPSVIVGVVGKAHVAGIVANWPYVKGIDRAHLVDTPDQSVGVMVKWSVFGFLAWGCYKGYNG